VSDAVLDACCLINLAAAGDLPELLPASGFTWHLPRRVEAQGLEVRLSPDSADIRRRPIDIAAAVGAGVLHRCDIDQSAHALFVELAAVHGDDSDAAALTIALSRGWMLATDDRALTRLAVSRGVPILTTPVVLRRVASTLGIAPLQIREMLGRVEQLGRWKPRDSDAEATWWKDNRGA
jgi:hypothetical protein